MPEDLAYSQETERFIVYPGNVIRLDRSIQPVLILVGQLVDGDGGILPAALMRTTEVLGRTDQEGYFQIDVVLGETVRVTQSNGETYRFAITEVMVSPEPYTNLGKVTCN